MNVAIKGHSKRGSEVIEILEMLGGENKYHINITEGNLLYTIREGDNAIIATYPNSSISQIYTLEEFLEKFPYKVGDKVLYKIYGIYSKIKSMLWNVEKEQVFYRLDLNKLFVATADELKPRKEETMEEPKELLIGFIKDKDGNMVLNTHKDYEIKEVDGKFMLLKKKPQYPKTYEECCENVFGIVHGGITVDLPMHYSPLFIHFAKLLICRDAYWKIAGEQMGLSKPWESDFTNDDEERYGIYTLANKVEKDFCGVGDVNMILVFPTEEMRDAFFDNFKDLIEQCKELL